MLPKDWRIPHGVSLSGLFNLFLLGVGNEGVPPLSWINNGFEVEHIPRGKRVLSDMKRLMKHVECCCKNHNPNAWEENIREWSVRKVNELYNTVWRCFNFGGNAVNETRFMTISWSSIIRSMYRKKLRTAPCCVRVGE